MRVRRLSDERGIALAVAVFALVVIGALVAGTFYAGRLEQQTGRNTFYAAQAAEAAEAGLGDAIVGSDGHDAAGPARPISTAGSTSARPTVGALGQLTANRSVNRLTDNLFLVRSVGSAHQANGTQLASRSMGQLVRLVQADLEVNAGLTALGDVTITGGAEVTGIDGCRRTWVGQACPARRRTTSPACGTTTAR